VARPPHRLLFDGKPDTRVVAITCSSTWVQALTEDGQVYYLGDMTYIPRRLELPDLRVRRMFPGVVMCDASARPNNPADYSRFAAQLCGDDVEMGRRREERRVKLKEEWSVMSAVHKIELRGKKAKRVVVRWRCPVWWAPRALREDCVALRAIDVQASADTEGESPVEAKVLLSVSSAIDELKGKGEVAFEVPQKPEGRYAFVYLRKMANGYTEQATSQNVTITHGVEVPGEDAHYRFPLRPLLFTKLQSFITCAPVKSCAKVLIKDLRKAELACKEKPSECATIAARTLLLCEDFTRNTYDTIPHIL
jgi:hypothetical protein